MVENNIRHHYEAYAFQNCIPISLTIELTLKCNLRCVHCYNFDRDKPLPEPNRSEELSRKEIIQVMEEARELGTLFLTFTGGEAMAHPDFWDLLKEANKRRFSVQVLTNATMIGPREAERLSELGVQKISTSFYGGTSETHDKITQKPGSFEQTKTAVKHLNRNKVRVLGKFIIMKGNKHEVDRMKNLASSLDMEYNINASITPRQDEVRDRGPLTERVTSESLEELYRNSMKDIILKDIDPDSSHPFRCNCARANCAVSSTGDVQPCIAVSWNAGNVRDQSLKNIWENSEVFNSIRNLDRDDFKHCEPCPVQNFCMRNNGQALLASGDYTGIDRWQCKEAEIVRNVFQEENTNSPS